MQDLFATIVALTIAATLPAAAQTFGPPTVLDGTETGIWGSTAMDAAGDEIATWSRNVSYRPAGGAWSAPISVWLPGFTEMTSENVKMTDAGAATVVFSDGTDTWALDVAPGGAFGSPYKVLLGASEPILVMNARGDAAIIASGGVPVGGYVNVVRRPAGAAGWGAVESFGPLPAVTLTEWSFADSAAIGNDGDLVVSWQSYKIRKHGKSYIYLDNVLHVASEGAAGSGWSESKALSRPSAVPIADAPFVGTSGAAGIVFSGQYGANLILGTSTRRSASGAWSKASAMATVPAVSGSSRNFLQPAGGEVDMAGNATVSYSAGVLTASGAIYVADGTTSNNHWGAPVALETGLDGVNGTLGVSPNVAFANNANGGVALAWSNPNAAISVLTRPATRAGWSAPQPVGAISCASATTICAGAMALSLSDDGSNEVIIWNDHATSPGTVNISATN